MAADTVAESKHLHLPSKIGDLPVGWSWKRLDEVCDGVFDCPHSTPQLVDTGPLIVRSQDIITGVFRTEQAAHVSNETYKERTSRAVPVRGDLLYSREGTYFGIAAEVPERTQVCLGQRMVLMRPKVGLVDFRFLCHWLNSPIMASHIHGYRDGTVAERLNLPTIRGLPVVVPPPREQHIIADILGVLNGKIELNRRMNETLETMARTLFKSWFVDFDPVRFKAEARDPHLPRPLADLFPDSLEDSEFGKIPKGWRWETLDGFAYLNPESWSKETRPETINYVDLSSTKWGNIDAITRYTSQDAPSRAQRVLRTGDTIVGTVRPGNGSYAFIFDDGLTGSTGFAALRPRCLTYAPFNYLAVTASENIETLAHLADGAAYPAIRSEVIIGMRVTHPGDELLTKFCRLTDPILAKMSKNKSESRTLHDLRDTLLSRLISGKLRINAEAFTRINA